MNLFSILNHGIELLQTNAIILTLLILVIFLIIIICLLSKHTTSTLARIDKLSKDLRSEIQDSIRPKFLEVSPAAEEMIALATEIWRFEQKFNKLEDQPSESYIKSTKHSIEKFKRYLAKYDIEIIDYTGQKFNDGLNVEILNTESNQSVQNAYIKETFEPAIMLRGTLIKRAKVILIDN